MSETGYETAYSLTTYEPVDDPDKLKAWWLRELPDDKEPAYSYRPYKVWVTRREKQGPRDTLFFVLVKDMRKQEFKVEFPIETNYAWPDLPSTAQLVERPGDTPSCAFLFLTDEWANVNGIDPRTHAEKPIVRRPGPMEGGGGKWPLAGGLKKAIHRVLQEVGNDSLRQDLLNLLAAKSVSKESGSNE